MATNEAASKVEKFAQDTTTLNWGGGGIGGRITWENREIVLGKDKNTKQIESFRKVGYKGEEMKKDIYENVWRRSNKI